MSWSEWVEHKMSNEKCSAGGMSSAGGTFFYFGPATRINRATCGLRKRFCREHEATAGHAMPLQRTVIKGFHTQRDPAFHSVVRPNRDQNRDPSFFTVRQGWSPKRRCACSGGDPIAPRPMNPCNEELRNCSDTSGHCAAEKVRPGRRPHC